MTSEASDPTLRGLGALTLLEPDPARRERVRRRCHAILAERQLQADRPRASGRSAEVVLESGRKTLVRAGEYPLPPVSNDEALLRNRVIRVVKKLRCLFP